MRPRGAIVVGGHVNGLGLLRALAARGVPTAVVTTKPWDLADRSRHARAHAPVADLERHPESLDDALERLGPAFAGALVVPANDEALAAASLAHERLSGRYRVAAPPAEIAAIFLDKERMSGVARELGLDLPVDYGRADEATAEREAIRFPALVKPVVGHHFAARFGRKLFLAEDRAALRAAVARVAAASLRAHVVDFVPGGDERIYAHATYLDRSGEPRADVTIRKLRQSPPTFGVACVAEIVETIPELRDATVALARRIGHRGIAVAEFKHDPRDERFRFLEVNGRSVIYNALLRRGGLDVAGLVWSEATSGRIEDASPRGGCATWVHLHADLLHHALARTRAPLAAFAGVYRRPLIEAVWSASDPVPFLVEWSRSAAAASRAIARGRWRELRP